MVNILNTNILEIVSALFMLLTGVFFIFKTTLNPILIMCTIFNLWAFYFAIWRAGSSNPRPSKIIIVDSLKKAVEEVQEKRE